MSTEDTSEESVVCDIIEELENVYGGILLIESHYPDVETVALASMGFSLRLRDVLEVVNSLENTTNRRLLRAEIQALAERGTAALLTYAPDLEEELETL